MIIKRLALRSGVHRVFLLGSDTSFPPEQFRVNIEMPEGNRISIDWGDGSIPTSYDGPLFYANLLTHNFLSGEYQVKIVGAHEEITKIHLSAYSLIGDIAVFKNMPQLTYLRLTCGVGLDYTSTTLPQWSGSEFHLSYARLISSEVDDFLVDLNAAGGVSGIVRLISPCQPPTATGLAAKTSLEGKGWTVEVAT